MGSTKNLSFEEKLKIAKAGIVLQAVVKENCILASSQEEHGYDIDRCSILKINSSGEVYIPSGTKLSIHFRVVRVNGVSDAALDIYFKDKSHLGSKNEKVEVMLEYLNAEYSDGMLKHKMLIGLSIGRYYDNMSGRFLIPISTISNAESSALVALMRDGWVLSIGGEGEDSLYVLYDPRDIMYISDTDGVREIEKSGKYACRQLYACLDWLINEFNDKGMILEREFPVNDYCDDFGEVIDEILMRGQWFSEQIEGWGIALRLTDSQFEFIEVHELGA